MGESSGCLVRSFSQPSPTSSEEKKGNPIQRALASSISFGRFMSESLDWEKWSAFNHNRYLEEAEKYSKPGSVAEKRAYFEAHYKRKRAAKLLEQQNAAANTLNEKNETLKVDDGFCVDLASTQSDSHNVIEKTNEHEVQNYATVSSVSEGIDNDAAVGRTSEDTQLCTIEEVTAPSVLMKNQVEPTNHLESDRCIGDTLSGEKDKIPEENAVSMRNPQSSIEEKPGVSSSVITAIGSSASKNAPFRKPILVPPVQINNSDRRTPSSKSKSRESSSKRRSNKMSLHMSIAYAPGIGDIQKPNSPELPKIANSKLFDRPPPAKFISSTVSQTSTRASVNGTFKHHSAIPPPDNRRTKTLNDKLTSGSRILNGKVQSPSRIHSQSSNSFGSKTTRLSTVSAPFTFKSEERAAKRKEFFQKLQQKWKSMESVKVEPCENSQARPSKRDLKDLCHSNAESPLITESLSNSFTEKTPSMKPCPHKIRERVVFKDQVNNPRPPWRFSLKTDSLKDTTGKKNSNQVSFSTSSKRSMRENDCPNVPV